MNETIWHRRGKPRPYTVWEGRRDGDARGYSYRRRWQAIVAAWWASRYTIHDVWIEREMPGSLPVDISPRSSAVDTWIERHTP